MVKMKSFQISVVTLLTILSASNVQTMTWIPSTSVADSELQNLIRIVVTNGFWKKSEAAEVYIYTISTPVSPGDVFFAIGKYTSIDGKFLVGTIGKTLVTFREYGNKVQDDVLKTHAEAIVQTMPKKNWALNWLSGKKLQSEEYIQTPAEAHLFREGNKKNLELKSYSMLTEDKSKFGGLYTAIKPEVDVGTFKPFDIYIGFSSTPVTESAFGAMNTKYVDFLGQKVADLHVAEDAFLEYLRTPHALTWVMLRDIKNLVFVKNCNILLEQFYTATPSWTSIALDSIWVHYTNIDSSLYRDLIDILIISQDRQKGFYLSGSFRSMKIKNFTAELGKSELEQLLQVERFENGVGWFAPRNLTIPDRHLKLIHDGLSSNQTVGHPVVAFDKNSQWIDSIGLLQFTTPAVNYCVFAKSSTAGTMYLGIVRIAGNTQKPVVATSDKGKEGVQDLLTSYLNGNGKSLSYHLRPEPVVKLK